MSRKIDHLADDLHVRCAGVEVFPPGASFGPSRVRHYAFVWIIEGGGTVCCDDHKITTRPGTILLWRPGMADHYDFGTKRQTVQAFTHFDVNLPTRRLPSP